MMRHDMTHPLLVEVNEMRLGYTGVENSHQDVSLRPFGAPEPKPVLQANTPAWECYAARLLHS
jgi:hypothetical protein